MILCNQRIEPDSREVAIAIKELSACNVLDPMIDNTMRTLVREVYKGEIYYQLLIKKYVTHEKSTYEILSNEFHVCRTSIYYMKKESLLYFGYILMTRAMPAARRDAINRCRSEEQKVEKSYT